AAQCRAPAQAFDVLRCVDSSGRRLLGAAAGGRELVGPTLAGWLDDSLAAAYVLELGRLGRRANIARSARRNLAAADRRAAKIRCRRWKLETQRPWRTAHCRRR